MKIKYFTLDTSKKDFEKKFKNRIRINSSTNKKAQDLVDTIISNIRSKGDSSLVNYVNKFDGYKIKNTKDILITSKQIKEAYSYIDKSQIMNLKKSISRIRKFAKQQKTIGWSDKYEGTILGEKVTPINSVGVYVPAGKASYPSTVLMNVIPAKVAGVKNIIMSCPINSVEEHALAIIAADLCGVDKIYRMGGAHAVSALAYGTKTIESVDKIVGPGNIYVTLAKKTVFGDVGIDNIAGPSEVVVVADKTNNPDWVAMDLFSQAEHDEDAQSILLCPDESFIEKVIESIARLLPTMKRRDIIAKALKDRGAIIKTKTLDEAVDLINQIAPEHLEVSTENPMSLLPKIKHAGAIFLGKNTCESLGDYCAGPNHVLPTSGTARYSSPLGVYDFQKKSSIIMASNQGSTELGKIASILADEEGLQAHAESARYRID